MASSTYRFVIDGRLPCLNDYLQKERIRIRTRNGKFTTAGNTLKHNSQEHIIACLRRDLKNLHIKGQVDIYYKVYEPNRKRDKDNCLSYIMKTTQDSLVIARVIDNDGWEYINKISADFYIDKDRPRIEVYLTTVDDDFGFNPYQE